jgi:hypothetical protein
MIRQPSLIIWMIIIAVRLADWLRRPRGQRSNHGD